MSVTRTRIVPIGNSRGIRIPKALLDQADLVNDVDLEVRDGVLVVRHAGKARQGWDEQFQLMAARGDDCLLDPELTSSESDDEWQW